MDLTLGSVFYRSDPEFRIRGILAAAMDTPATARKLSVEELLRSDRGWMLCFVAEDQSAQLGRLIDDLSRAPSPTGDGKRIESGFAYWGVGPSVAWERACTDPAYLVMRESIESFGDRFQHLKPSLPAGLSRMHYVSLGVGTGHKDAHILRHLSSLADSICYFAVDMSAEMLRFGVRKSVESLRGREHLIFPIQIDFSRPKNLDALRKLIDRWVGDEPVLFSLLGNTLGNFKNDAELLKHISRILRPQDRLLLELASTDFADERVANRAASEYLRSQRFRLFVTSALLHNTDVPIDVDRVEIIPTVEEERAICLKVVYTNKRQAEHITLPDRLTVPFPKNDTIRLLLTRKYTKAGIASLVDEAGCSTNDSFAAKFDNDRYFGIALNLISQRTGKVFVSYSHADRDFVQRLRQELVSHGIHAWTDFTDTDPDTKLFEQIEQAIRVADRVLLVFSDSSKDREWVRAEVKLAFRNLPPAERPKLCVLLLTSARTVRAWECLDEQGTNLGAKLLEFPLEDFQDWKEWDVETFRERVWRLVKTLRT
jgi:L-histidine Nalpha-methyltransferase